jgi:hypothetical protein
MKTGNIKYVAVGMDEVHEYEVNGVGSFCLCCWMIHCNIGMYFVETYIC